MEQEDYVAQWCVEGFIRLGNDYLSRNRAVEILDNPDFPFWMYEEDDDAMKSLLKPEVS